MNPFITIITPVRNEGKFIEKYLQSIINQDYDEGSYEVLIIDGMSEDDSREIVARYQRNNHNIKLLQNPQKITPTALNIGITSARGDIIIRIDGHVIVEKDYLRQCIKYLNSTNADCVGGQIESVNDTVRGKAIALAMSSPFGVGNARFRTSGKEGFVDTLAFGAYRKQIFEELGLFDEELIRSQDDELNYRLRKAGKKIFFTPNIKAYYFPRSNLKALWSQYFQYGFWKVRVLQKHFSMMQPRQFVPPVFVSVMGGSALGGFFSKVAFQVFMFIAALYLMLSIIFSLKIAITKKKILYSPLLPVIFAILHISYGCGFIWGAIRFSKYWIKSGKQT